MQYDYLTESQQLSRFCTEMVDAPVIAFDTEFVSEDAYRPQLCLIQVAAAGRIVIIDPLSIDEITPFWDLIAAPGHKTVVHAGRQEFLFCTNAIGKRPHEWFDIQLAAGFVGMEYPAAYNTLIARLLGQSISKGETRTNWRRRPLSRRQLDYAANDVVYLQPIHDLLWEQIHDLDRANWLEEEVESWQRQVEDAEQLDPWRRISGISSLKGPRQLAVARELWRWREQQAESRNCPPKRVLRDDLIIELARRQQSDVRQIRAIRGLERRNVQRHVEEMAEWIDRALKLDDQLCPRPLGNSRQNAPQMALLGQYLSVALGSLCRSQKLAPNLVSTVQDLRDLVAYHLDLGGHKPKSPPALARGWRARVVGHVIEELLEGKLAVRVRDPLADNPLDLERSDS